MKFFFLKVLHFYKPPKVYQNNFVPFVLLGDNPGSKFDKAKELGIKILSEAEFLSLVDFNE